MEIENTNIFFFPFAEPKEMTLGETASSILARRIPDFLCICLNSGEEERVGMLEIRAANEQGEPTGDWARFREEPSWEEALFLLPNPQNSIAISGSIRGLTAEILTLSLSIHFGAEAGKTEEFLWKVDLGDPSTSFFALAKKLGRILGIKIPNKLEESQKTRDPEAFWHFLRGLDGAASLDPNFLSPVDAVESLKPFIKALQIDPSFGLSLNRLFGAIHEAWDSHILHEKEALELFDQALEAHPEDSESVTGIGEFLAAHNETQRAEAWLQVAVEVGDPPPAASLESLGILLANRGETVRARNLWRSAVHLDGHPDFFAHLARLAFLENNYDEAWDKVLRGLRRIYERSLHPSEWGQEAHRGGVLLRYLGEHLEEILDRKDPKHLPPEDVKEILLDLTRQIHEPEDRLDLGICLSILGTVEEAKHALRASIPHVEDPDRRDLGCQYLGRLLFPNFDQELKRTLAVRDLGEEAQAAQNFLSAVAKEIPQCWVAIAQLGKLACLRKDWELALSYYKRATFLRRDRKELYSQLSLCHFRCGEMDDALVAIREAMDIEPEDAGIHADYALLLHRMGFEDEARDAIDIAELLEPEHPTVKRVLDILGEDFKPPRDGD
ncbi:MAG TPA: tetratricopeptide repeat protein [Planctomycetes bacterium]|nr:tetratricopeptide repeat protein [Planctomycetota bacterium]